MIRLAAPGSRLPARLLAAAALVAFCLPSAAMAQMVSQRGFIDVAATGFLEEAPNDRERGVADVLAREEVFLRPAPWLQGNAGVDVRFNSHDQVADSWDVDFFDRGPQRQRLAVRRVGATVARGPLTLEVGKQVFGWGRADIVNPTDRFGAQDYLTVVNREPLGMVGGRLSVQRGAHVVEAVWVPRPTVSRVPLPNQRWAAFVDDLPSDVALVEMNPAYPRRQAAGLRWNYVGERLEYSLSVFEGPNHLPHFMVGAPTPVPGVPDGEGVSVVQVQRVYPRIRAYGADTVVPTRWITVKAEAAYIAPTAGISDEYLLYTIQVERQQGDWLLGGGYVGEHAVQRTGIVSFDPDRGLARAFVARLSYTIGSTRTVELESVVRRDGDGVYGRVEYAQTYGSHWRFSVTGVALGGRDEDFLGGYRHNSHVRAATRFSF